MALNLATASDYLVRTTSLVNCTTGPSTTMLWVKQAVLTASGVTFWMQLDDPGTYLDWCGLFGHLTPLHDVYGSCATGGVAVETTPTTRTVNTWIHVTIVRSAANATLVMISGKQQGSIVKDLTAASLTKEYIGNDTFSSGNLAIAYARQWSAELSLDEVAIEMQATSAVRTADLWGDWPFTSTILDVSGNGRNWTQVGSATFVAGPSFPSNNSAATATALTSPAGQSFVLDMADGAYAWYSYTPSVDTEIAFGFWAFYDFTKVDDLLLSVWSGPTDALTEWPNSTNPEGGSSVPFQIPVTFGTTVYIQLRPHNVASTPFTSDITITVTAAPDDDVPIGAIAVNDDLTGFPLAISSAATGQVIRFIGDFRASGSGCVMPVTGEILIDGNGEEDFFFLYDDTYTLLTTIPYPEPSSTSFSVPFVMCATQGGGLFYVHTAQVADKGGKAVITSYDTTGTLVASYTITTVTSIRACAANATNEILYYVTAGANVAVRRWDLVNDVALSDLIAGQGAGFVHTPDIVVLSDGTIILSYAKAGSDKVLAVNPAGTILQTFTGFEANSSIDHTCTAVEDPVSIWVWFHNQVPPHTHASRFLNIQVSDGTYLNDIDSQQYEQGQYGGDFTTDPTDLFGHSNSCPFWIVRVGITPPTPTPSEVVTEYLIRRERWFPVISKEQHRMFFHKLQLYFESGTGIPSGQGSNPLVELDWSDDGGHTWSHLHLLERGPQGEFKRRIIQHNMGQARERIYRVAVSDPVQWSLMDAFLDLTEGVN